MTIHEYGADREKVIVLIHPSVVMWDYFENVIPLLKDKYHLIIPALPGYDEENPNEDFTSVEEIADNLVKWLIEHKIRTIDTLYGCSMGGAIVLKMIAEQKIIIKNAVCDGGITPYQLPWLITRFIAIKDFLLISMGKIGGLGLLEKAFSTDEYSKEDLKYIVKVLHFISYKTIWRTFDSCNNYVMPRTYLNMKGVCNIGMEIRKQKTEHGILNILKIIFQIQGLSILKIWDMVVWQVFILKKWSGVWKL